MINNINFSEWITNLSGRWNTYESKNFMAVLNHAKVMDGLDPATSNLD